MKPKRRITITIDAPPGFSSYVRTPGQVTAGDPDVTLAEIERAHILGVLAECGDDRDEAIVRLGISLRTLQRKLKEWGMVDEERSRSRARGARKARRHRG